MLESCYEAKFLTLSTEHDAAAGPSGRSGETRPLNAFELINAALDISSLFERRSDVVKRHTRFTSREVPERIAEVLESAHRQLGGRSERNSFKCAPGLWGSQFLWAFGSGDRVFLAFSKAVGL